MFQSLEYKHPKFYQVFRLFIVFFASLLYAWNLRCFAKTAGLFPGGFSGLSLLLQQIGLDFIHVSIPFSVFNIGLNLVPTYIAYKFIGKKIYSVFYYCYCTDEYFYRYASGVCVYKGCAVDQCVRWTDQWICHQSVFKCRHHHGWHRLYQHLFITAEGH